MNATPAAPWAALLPAALAGTRRQPFAPVPGLSPNLGGEANAPEKSLLLTAARLTLVRRAGRRPAAGPARPLPRAGADHLPVLGAVGATWLQQVLADRLSHRTGEQCLELLSARQLRVPPRLLPRLLAFVRHHRAYYLLARLPEVLGARGRWLAGFLPDADLQANVSEAAWQPGVPARQQPAALERLARGAPAWSWPLATLPAEPLLNQLYLLGVLRQWARLVPPPPPLAAPLEELLETLLDQPDVRPYAAEVLALLPGSALAARHWARAQPLLSCPPGATGLHATPPTRDAAWERDNLPPAVLIRQQPDDLEPLRELLGWVPPDRWLEAWQLTPAEAVARAAASQHADVVLTGWLYAAGRYRHPELARALLAHVAGQPTPLRSDYDQLRALAPALRVLPGPEQAAWVLARLPTASPTADELAVTGLPGIPGWLPWLRVVMELKREPDRQLPALGAGLLPLLRGYLSCPASQVVDEAETWLAAVVLSELPRPGNQFLLPRLEAELLPLARRWPGRPLATYVEEATQILACGRDVAAAPPAPAPAAT